MLVEFRVSRFPTKRHNNLGVDKGCVGNNTALFIRTFVIRNGYRPHHTFKVLLVLRSAVIGFHPDFLRALRVYHS